MEELYRHLGSDSRWSDPETDWCLFEATEIWRSQISGRLWIQHGGLTSQSLAAWLSGDSTKHDSSGEPSACLAQIVVAGKTARQQHQQQCKCGSVDCFSQLVDHFGLRLAYDYALSCVAGVAALPRQSPSGEGAYTLA
jgi:hypothetical protein